MYKPKYKKKKIYIYIYIYIKKSRNTTIRSEGERQAEIHEKNLRNPETQQSDQREKEYSNQIGEATWVAAQPGS